jgi:excisionase family DNA binding protein
MNKVETKGGLDERMRAQGYVTAKEVAGWLGRHVTGVYDLVDNGKVEGMRVGRARFIKLASLRQYLGPQAASALGVPAR